MDKEFYKNKLTELQDLVRRTEVMLEPKAEDDLINLYSFRSRLKQLVEDCNNEIDKRLE